MLLSDAKIESVTIGGIRNVHEFGSYLLGGQPTEADFELLKARGVRTVVTLRTDSELGDFDEGAFVEKLGMNFVSIPFRAPETLTDDVFDSVRAQLNEAEGPVFLHCGSANRVGGVWIPWRVLDGGVSVEQAVAEGHEIGLRVDAYEERALDYVARKSE